MAIYNICILSFSVLFVLFSATDSYAQNKGKNLKNYQDMVAAYNKGDKSQSLNIALAYKNGSAGAARDSGLALEWLDKAFDAGIYRAATIAGTMYYKGDGIARDFSKAEKYYRKAAAKGNEDAMLRLGFMYQHGYGFEKSLASAKKWYGLAAKKHEKGTCTEACSRYADVCRYLSDSEPDYKPDHNEAIKWYKKAHEAGYYDVSSKLASLLYALRSQANPKTAGQQAIKYLYEAASQGYDSAMIELAKAYYNGTYGKPDMINASAWAALLIYRGIDTDDIADIAKQAVAKMNNADRSKAKKTAEDLIKKIGKKEYPLKYDDLD